MTDLSAERVRELFHYDSETGVFTRLVSRPGRNAKAGDVAGTLHRQGYVHICVDKRSYKAHRLAWLYIHGSFPPAEIDHRNGDKSDNRLSNLREVTRSENQQNLRKARSDNVSGLIGARWNKQHGRWYARIQHHDKELFLGYFPTAEIAHQTYLSAKRELHPMCTI